MDVASRLDMLDIVQAVLSHLTQQLGFDDDSRHYMTVAVRESVVNAMKHGNAMDEAKRVEVTFGMHDSSLDIEVRDHGKGFAPGEVLDPLAPENLLRADGRGIFFMRSFMDDVSYDFPSGGGTVVKLRKKLPEAPETADKA